MNPFKKIGSAFLGIGKLAGKGLVIANQHGLTDDLLNLALGRVELAQVKFGDNEVKRNYVLDYLVNKGTNESVARIAIELAVQLLDKTKTEPIPLASDQPPT